MRYFLTLLQLVMMFFMLTAIVLLVSLLSSCDVKEALSPIVTSTTVKAESTTTTTLLRGYPTPISWEKNHPERIKWSDFLHMKLSISLFAQFDKASDNKRLCPNYDSMTKEQKITAWMELVSAMAFYESSWNPKSASPDVGTPANKDTWSTGLLQVSVTDQWGDIPKLYSYNHLLEPIPNLDLGLKLMSRQLKNRNKFILPNSDKYRYWAVLLDGNKYSKVSEIISMVRKMPGCVK